MSSDAGHFAPPRRAAMLRLARGPPPQRAKLRGSEEETEPMRIISGISIATLLGSAAAQTTWTVPNGANLHPFIANAAPGDVLVLGAYHPAFNLDKGLVLRPALGRTTIAALGSTLNVPTGQHASFADIDFVPFNLGFGLMGACLQVNGSVALDRCTVTSAAYTGVPPFGVHVQGGSLALTSCTLQTVNSGSSTNVVPLGVGSGTCSAVDCTFVGAGATGNAFPTSGAVVNGGLLVLSHCTLTAGATGGVIGFWLGPSSGLRVAAIATAFATDCTVSGGSAPPSAPTPLPGGSAILVQGTGAAYVARCTLIPGTGQPPGTPTSGNVVTEPAQVGITSTGPLLLGTTTTLTAVSGSSGQPLAFAFWPTLGVANVPPVVEPLWGPAATAVLVNLTVPLPGALVSLPIAVPNVLALANSSLWLQALQLDWPAVRASAVVGGVIR